MESSKVELVIMQKLRAFVQIWHKKTVDFWIDRPLTQAMICGRPLEYDIDTALDAAMHLFWEQGYEATSMSDLLRAMGLSKSSLYHRFGGKKELFLQCMARYSEAIGVRITTPMPCPAI